MYMHNLNIAVCDDITFMNQKAAFRESGSI